MTRDDIRAKIVNIVNRHLMHSDTRISDTLTDFILENFVEKPKPTAVERLEGLLISAVGPHIARHLAERLLTPGRFIDNRVEVNMFDSLQDIIEQRIEELKIKL